MILCDRCNAPGACCRGFTIYQLVPRVPADVYEECVVRAVERLRTDFGIDYFVPSKRVIPPELGAVGDVAIAEWSCTRLGPDGRCTRYEDRPQVCRSYQPMDDALCHVRHLRGIPIFVEHCA